MKSDDKVSFKGLAVVLLLAALPFQALGREAPRSTFRMPYAYTVYRNMFDAQSVEQMIRQDDKIAAGKIIEDRTRDGTGWRLEKNQEVFVMRSVEMDGIEYECIRIRGATECGWRAR